MYKNPPLRDYACHFHPWVFKNPRLGIAVKTFAILLVLWLMPFVGSHFTGFPPREIWLGWDFITPWWHTVREYAMRYTPIFIVCYLLGVASVVLWWKKPHFLTFLSMAFVLIFLCGSFMFCIFFSYAWRN